MKNTINFAGLLMTEEQSTFKGFWVNTDSGLASLIGYGTKQIETTYVSLHQYPNAEFIRLNKEDYTTKPGEFLIFNTSKPKADEEMNDLINGKIIWKDCTTASEVDSFLCNVYVRQEGFFISIRKYDNQFLVFFKYKN